MHGAVLARAFTHILRLQDDQPPDEPSELEEPGETLERPLGSVGPRRPGHLPLRLFLIVQLLGRFAEAPRVFLVDAYSGKGGLSWAFRKHKKPTCRHDINLDPLDDPCLPTVLYHVFCMHVCYSMLYSCMECTWPAQDILTDIGFLRHLWSVMQMFRGGLLSLAIKCSSWSAMSRLKAAAPYVCI